MRALLCFLSIMSASAALAQPVPADTMTVTAERLSRGALRAQASKFMRTALADTRNGQNARWFTPLCPVALGVEERVGRLFTSRIADVARHVGLKLAGGDCDPNIAVVFTRDARALVRTVNRRQNGALDALPGPERALLKSPTLPVRWWHFTAPESGDGKPSAQARWDWAPAPTACRAKSPTTTMPVPRGSTSHRASASRAQ